MSLFSTKQTLKHSNSLIDMVVTGSVSSIGLLLSIFMLLTPTSYNTDAPYICGVIFLAFSALLALGKVSFKDFSNTCMKDKLFCGALTALLVVMIGISEIVKAKFLAEAHVALKIFLCILVFAYLLFSIYFLLLKVVKVLLEYGEKSSKQSKKTLIICILTVCITTLAFFIACPQGLVYSDGVSVWLQTQSNTYSDWHPIVFVLIVKLCSLIYNSTVSYVAFLSILWALTNSLVLCVLHRHHGDRACKLYVGISLTFGLIAYKYIVYVYKDPLFCMAMLGFFAYLYDFTCGRRKISVFVALLVYGLLASTARHAMILPIGITLAIAIICSVIAKFKNKNNLHGLSKKYTKRFLVILLVSLIVLNSTIHTIAMKTTQAEENPSYVAYTVPIHMIGAYAASGHEIDAETKELMERVMPIEEWANGYNSNPYWADTLSREWGYIGNRLDILKEEISGSELISANLRFFLAHPITYVRDLGKISSMVWQISRPDGFDEWYGPDFFNSSDSLYYLIEGYELNPNGFTSILTSVLTFFKKVPVLSNITCRGGVALFTLILCAYVMWRKHCGAKLLFMIPAFILAALLILTLPAQDPRYMLWAIELATFTVPITACMKNKTNILEQQKGKNHEKNCSIDSLL